MPKSLYYVTGDGTYDEFMDLYEPMMVTKTPDLLLEAMSNHSAKDRVQIVNHLLDDGIDAFYSREDGLNALHILFSNAL